MNADLSTLPNETVFMILEKLDFQSLLAVNRTCKWIHVVSNRLVEKRTTFHFYYPFPSWSIVMNLWRQYETVTLRYDDFIDELGKTSKALSMLDCRNVKTVNLVIIFMKLYYSEEFVEFIRQLPKLKNIRFIGRNRSLEEELKKYATLTFVDNEEKEIGSVSCLDEMDFLDDFKDSSQVRCLSILNFKTSEEPSEITNFIQSHHIDFDCVEELHLSCLGFITGKPKSLLLFKNLRKLVVNDWLGSSIDLEFLQSIYENNKQTLRFLEVDLDFNKCEAIPSLNLALKLQSFRLSYFKDYFQVRPFIAEFLKQQGSNLKELIIKNIPIEQLPFSEMEALTELDIQMNHWLYILSDDLFKILTLKFSETLEKLVLRGIRSTSGSHRYKFPSLKKLIFEGNTPFLFHFLEAPNLEHLVYYCNSDDFPDLKIFPRLRLLFVHLNSFPLSELLGIIRNSPFLETLAIEIQTEVLEDALDALWVCRTCSFVA